MRRTDDVRETVDEILAEQHRAWVRRVVFAGKSGAPTRAPRSRRLIIVGRVGSLLLSTAIGGVIGAVTGDAATGTILGLVVGVMLGSIVTTYGRIGEGQNTAREGTGYHARKSKSRV